MERLQDQWNSNTLKHCDLHSVCYYAIKIEKKTMLQCNLNVGLIITYKTPELWLNYYFTNASLLSPLFNVDFSKQTTHRCRKIVY